MQLATFQDLALRDNNTLPLTFCYQAVYLHVILQPSDVALLSKQRFLSSAVMSGCAATSLSHSSSHPRNSFSIHCKKRYLVVVSFNFRQMVNYRQLTNPARSRVQDKSREVVYNLQLQNVTSMGILISLFDQRSNCLDEELILIMLHRAFFIGTCFRWTVRNVITKMTYLTSNLQSLLEFSTFFHLLFVLSPSDLYLMFITSNTELNFCMNSIVLLCPSSPIMVNAFATDWLSTCKEKILNNPSVT